jgi:uncharacterized membrane protein (DUF2068 family)
LPISSVAADPSVPHKRSDRLLRLIAIERGIRAILLIGVGLIIVTHLKSDWSRTLTDLTRQIGLDARHNAVGHFISKAGALSLSKRVEFAVIAIAYGILEGVESYGLWRRRRWAEYLTIVATALLLIPEIDELIRRPTALKAAAFVVNLAIVIYLIARVRRTPPGRA